MLCRKNEKTAAVDLLYQSEQQSSPLQSHSRFPIREHEEHKQRLSQVPRMEDQRLIQIEDLEAPTRGRRQQANELGRVVITPDGNNSTAI